MEIKCLKCGTYYNSLYYDFHSCRNAERLNDQNISQIKKELTIPKYTLYVGIITLWVAISTFWVTEYNKYITIGNDIKIETEENLKMTQFILRDQKNEWLYLVNLSNKIYKNNWNYIVQYYSDCLEDFRTVTTNIDSINTLILLRQNNDKDPQHAQDLHIFTNNLNYQLSYILDYCEIKPILLFYKLYQ